MGYVWNTWPAFDACTVAPHTQNGKKKKKKKNPFDSTCPYDTNEGFMDKLISVN